MRRILLTNARNYSALFARMAAAAVIFPHGAQKLLGLFGGGGFYGTLDFMTEVKGLPWTVGLMVIIVEFFFSVFLFLGFLTRFMALALIGLFVGIVHSGSADGGFFMNWAGVDDRPEGLEYFILMFGLLLVSLIAGGGALSLDAAMTKRRDRLYY